MDRLEYDSMASPRVMTLLLGIFAGLALLISSSGIAAVMALSVTQRAHELGIRMALGAERSAIVGMVVKQGLALAAVGTLIGIAGAALLARTLSTMLYDTNPTDVLTFLAVSLLFLTVAAVACFIPARHVTGIDPLDGFAAGVATALRLTGVVPGRSPKCWPPSAAVKPRISIIR